MAKTTKEIIEVMEWFDGGGAVEYVEKGYDDWEIVTKPLWNWDDFEYRIKEFQYPMWFESKHYEGLIIRFDSIDKGTCINVGSSDLHGWYLNETSEGIREHTDSECWEQIEEPQPKQKVTIEKWLIEENDIKFTIETSDIDAWLKSFPTAQKLKLIESYEVEI